MNPTTDPPEHVTSITLTNDRPVQIQFKLEPWGENYVMPPGGTVHVVAKGPAGGTLDVHIANNEITIWSWTGSSVRLFNNRAESADEAQNPIAT
jgi:hypothetical protein